MSKFKNVDPIISEWGAERSLNWLTEYQDTEVRTVFLEPDTNERVQIWIDPPKLGFTVVHVFQQKSGRRSKKIFSIPTLNTGLYKALDKAFDIAEEWLYG